MLFLDDAVREELIATNAGFRLRTKGGEECPTCHNTGSYRFQGKKHRCKLDKYGRHIQLQLFELYSLANIPLEFQVLAMESFPHPELAKEIQDYIDQFDSMSMAGIGWEFYGRNKGVGKSYAATLILRGVVKAGRTGWFYQFNDAKRLYQMTDAKRRDFFERKLRESEILVLDEVLEPAASEAQRRFYEDQLEDIIRYRTMNCFPTIITTNLDEEKMQRYYPRVSSLLSAKQKRTELLGEDYRGKAWRYNSELALNGEVAPIV